MVDAREFGRRTVVSEQPKLGLPTGKLAMVFAAGLGAIASLVIGALVLSSPKTPAVVANVLPDKPPASLDHQVPVTAEGPAWVFVRELRPHTCPNVSCGGTGRVYYHQKLDVYQIHDGWARITKRYIAICEDGVSPFVKVGDNRCIGTNGFSNDGRIAEWVPIETLTATAPPELGANVAEDAKYLAASDDVDLYERQFVVGANELVRKGYCTRQEIQNSGGFIRSSDIDRPSVYFIICGTNRPHVDVATGEVSRGE